MISKIFPTILIILDICAAIGYIPIGDWKKNDLLDSRSNFDSLRYLLAERRDKWIIK